ncbi:MRG-domain-containing protein [Hyaloscypha hepaticicola]|uniref:Chromatin modification-related protein EAF3 n=1 Tax=Hyaloscypha hepaticicola TaxID=2082293 RepID=A0A2J6QC10_9HELO|nr:MRG-domain-containing protein [Hyaloscypha hepaticicola]
MAPSKASQATAPYVKDERVLCFHHEMLYEAKILDVRPTEEGQSWQYKIHYKGWKNTWDDWVPQDRVRKFTDENKELAAQLHNQMKLLQQKAPKSVGKGQGKRGANGSDFSSARGSEERTGSVAAAPGRGGPRRNRDYDLEHEEQFHARPSIKLTVPDHIKAILVDDWENVTKNLQLVPLPAAKPVNLILNDYLQYEKPRRQAGSAQADILDEVVAGLKEYFEKCLGRILLYRFERHQYSEVREGIAKNTGDFAGKGVGDIYGAEHLCRLLVSLPELIAQTNMDHQSVNRLREELTKLTNWLGRNYLTYFVSEYEIPGQEYIEKAKSL